MYDIRNSSGERLDHHFHPAERRDALVILGHGLTGNKDRPLLVALAEGLSARGWPCLRISFSGKSKRMEQPESIARYSSRWAKIV